MPRQSAKLMLEEGRKYVKKYGMNSTNIPIIGVPHTVAYCPRGLIMMFAEDNHGAFEMPTNVYAAKALKALDKAAKKLGEDGRYDRGPGGSAEHYMIAHPRSGLKLIDEALKLV